MTSWFHRHLPIAVFFSLLAGIMMVAEGGYGTLKASLSGGGSDILHSAAPAGEEMLVDAVTHSAGVVALYERAAAGQELVLGVLLIVLGFFLHAWLTSQSERRVRVHAGPSKSEPTVRPTSIRQIYWVEMQI